MNDIPTGTSCPLPISRYENILLAHGGGGRLMHRLLEEIFLPAFDNPALAARHDGAQLNLGGEQLAFTTDAYVVRPLFFPGGDIGTLAINGTLNDLAMCGARPVALSAAFILEEGLPVDTLRRVVQSMRQAAAAAGVPLVTGDTKVVDRGRADGLYITTTGLGRIPAGVRIGPDRIQPGDHLLINGDVGRHGVAIMAVREGLGFETSITSDCAPLVNPVFRLIENGVHVRCLRDLTRGGLASALVELAETTGLDLLVDESAVPVSEEVQGACEILGLDPLHVANEGRFLAVVAPGDSDRALELLREAAPDLPAARIGEVRGPGQGRVTLRSRIGAPRILDMFSGEQLPRIC
jgi:hydrogenase expression/formation protein HypE